MISPRARKFPAQGRGNWISIRRSLVGWLVFRLLQPPPIVIPSVTAIEPQLSLGGGSADLPGHERRSKLACRGAACERRVS